MTGEPGGLAEVSAALISSDDSDLTREEWLAIGEQFSHAHREIPWLIADWALYGLDRFHDANVAMADVLGHVSPDRIASFIHVGSRFEPERRRLDLSFTHHEEVASLPARIADDLLAAAAEARSSTRELRAAARDATRRIRGRAIEAASTQTDEPTVEPDRVGRLVDLFADTYASKGGARLEPAAARSALVAVLAEIRWNQ